MPTSTARQPSHRTTDKPVASTRDNSLARFMQARKYVTRAQSFSTTFLNPAGGANASAPSDSLLSDSNSEVTFSGTIKPFIAAGIGVAGVVAAAVSSGFFLRLNSEPAICPANPPGLADSLLPESAVC